jgi:hypothetical protein
VSPLPLLHRQLDDLLRVLRRDPERADARGPAARARPTEPSARLQAVSIKSVVGGSTNDVQRNLNAHTLGLPR